MNRRQFLAATAGLAASGLSAPRLAHADDNRILRFVPYADVAVIDPIWTTAYSTRTHALMVFDTLYGYDEQFQPQPQMAAGHSVEDDGKIWRITLRPGLKFHDGTPVLAKDCVASLLRWGRRDAFGQSLIAAADEISAPDDKTILFRMKRPFPLLLAALGRPSSLIPVIMPERLAKTDAFTQVPEAIGSGPFKFVPGERVPGARVVYERFADYVPREEKPSFTAGGRVVHFDRVEFNVIGDAATAAAALQSGAVDWVEQPMIDLLPTLRRNRDIVVEVKDPTGMIGHLRFNHLHPPFNNVAIRRVVQKAISQTDCMTAVAGSDKSLWSDRVGTFTPGLPMASDVGLEALGKAEPDYAALKKELIEAGYKGEKVVMLAGADVPRISAVCEVTAEALRQIGMVIDYVPADWGTVIQRITNRRPIDQGGWNLYCTYWSGLDLATPASHTPLRANGERAPTGWPDSPALEALRDGWLAAPDLAAQQALAKDIQRQALQDVPYVSLGQFKQPIAYRRNLTGMMTGVPVMTNLRKV
ncbi:ABC transporter substrate-binding protein [Acetobacteraceae bacterium H6797]|nr:ABC transporter substrate-binding protein [Acetobacteraceae bacterium H6797]